MLANAIAFDEDGAATNNFELWTIQDDGTNQTLRVNGAGVSLTPNNTTPNAPSAVSTVGATDAGAAGLIGSIWEVIAFNRVLSANEISLVESYVRATTLLW